MLTQNRFGRYLFYAIGEIILVIIGILIALQINNWNERRKTEAELQSGLNAMVEELNKNVNYLKDTKESFERRRGDLDSVISNNFTDDDLRTIINIATND